MAKQTTSLAIEQKSHNPFLLAKRTLQRPKQVCSIFPSSPAVGREMLKSIAKRPNPYLLEFGAGTGPVTKELLRAGVKPDHLKIVEIDDELVSHLNKRFPNLEILHQPAENMATIWRKRELPKVGAIISTMPMRLFNEHETYKIMQSSLEILSRGGIFAQLTYRLRSPIMPAILQKFDIVANRKSIVMSNVPPAFIWTYQRREDLD